MSTIDELEQLAFSAWPAAEVLELEGWRCRAMAGVTRRANSVFTCGAVADVGAALARAEAFYAARHQPVIFQLGPISEPADLDARLAARGYVVDAPVSIQTAALDAVLGSDLDAKAALGEVARAASDEWRELAILRSRFAAHAEVFSGLLERIGPRAAFAVARVSGKAVASALGVSERGILGIFAMATEAEARRSGAASALLRALARWGLSQGLGEAYLQVERSNRAAGELYARAGFRELYGYHYRLKHNP